MKENIRHEYCPDTFSRPARHGFHNVEPTISH